MVWTKVTHPYILISCSNTVHAAVMIKKKEKDMEISDSVHFLGENLAD